jgi:hypothetical protein
MRFSSKSASPDKGSMFTFVTVLMEAALLIDFSLYRPCSRVISANSGSTKTSVTVFMVSDFLSVCALKSVLSIVLSANSGSTWTSVTVLIDSDFLKESLLNLTCSTLDSTLRGSTWTSVTVLWEEGLDTVFCFSRTNWLTGISSLLSEPLSRLKECSSNCSGICSRLFPRSMEVIGACRFCCRSSSRIRLMSDSPSLCDLSIFPSMSSIDI